MNGQPTYEISVDRLRVHGVRLCLGLVLGVAWAAPSSGCGGARAEGSGSQSTVSEPKGAEGSNSMNVQSTTASHTAANPRIYRARLIPVLDRGLGQFLAYIQASPVTEGKRLVGFRVGRLPNGGVAGDGGSLRAGDIVTRVNGVRIVKPDDAQFVWEGLRVASGLVVEYVREGANATVSWNITDND